MPLHPVDRVELRGIARVSDDELRRVVTGPLRPGPVGQAAGEVAEALRAVYRARGYPSAQVTPQVEETHEPDRATLASRGRRRARAPPSAPCECFEVDAEGAPTIDERPAIREGETFDEPAAIAWRSRAGTAALPRARLLRGARAAHGAPSWTVTRW